MNNKKLHERIIAGIVLVTISLAAYAVEHGVATGTGSGVDRAWACTLAKNSASARVPFDATVTSYGACDCSSSSTSWTCNVDAYWEKK
jgi:hypothetical protein